MHLPDSDERKRPCCTPEAGADTTQPDTEAPVVAHVHARHRACRAFTGPGSGKPPSYRASGCETEVAHRRGRDMPAPLKTEVFDATGLYPAVTSSRRFRCQNHRSPETEQQRLLQGFAPPTSLYRVPPLPAVHTAFLPWAWFLFEVSHDRLLPVLSARNRRSGPLRRGGLHYRAADRLRYTSLQKFPSCRSKERSRRLSSRLIHTADDQGHQAVWTSMRFVTSKNEPQETTDRKSVV